MNRKLFVTVLYIIYSLPYAYFGMYQDFTNRYIWGYAVMGLVAIVIPIVAKNMNVIINNMSIVGCNFISFIISVIFLKYMMGERWSVYFKPLTPMQFLILMTFINIVLGIVTLYIVNKSKLKV